MQHRSFKHPAICGRNILKHRVRQGLSQRQLAKLARTTLGTIELLENGEIDPDFDVCVRIILALQILPEDFFDGVMELSMSPKMPAFVTDTLDDVETGEGSLTLSTVIELARRYEVDPAELCEDFETVWDVA